MEDAGSTMFLQGFVTPLPEILKPVFNLVGLYYNPLLQPIDFRIKWKRHSSCILS
jgi:hypothetical protein